MNVNKQHILFVCSTPFQIIVATQIIQHNKKGADADIIITNHSKEYLKLADGVKKTGIYNNVFILKCKRTVKHGNTLFDSISYHTRRCKEIVSDWIKSKIFAKDKKYDEIYIINISVITVFLYNALLQKNRNIKLNIFEEGMSTYCHSYTDADKPSSLHRRFVNSSGIINNTRGLWVFRPELLQWSIPNGEIHKIQPFDIKDTYFVNTINTIFDINNIKDSYEEKVIFFEESFYADGININDIEILQKLAQIYGKQNILVKLHPRDTINRFAPLGFKTNIDTSIPWEALVLNKDFSDKILITISSGSTLYPYLYFGIKAKCISLLNCLNVRPGNMQGELGEMMLKAYHMYPDVFSTPSSFDELRKYNR